MKIYINLPDYFTKYSQTSRFYNLSSFFLKIYLDLSFFELKNQAQGVASNILKSI